MTYEAGFAAGERAAWIDRRDGTVTECPPSMHGDFLRGWRDGYTPRSATWAVRKTAPWWEVRREVVA